MTDVFVWDWLTCDTCFRILGATFLVIFLRFLQNSETNKGQQAKQGAEEQHVTCSSPGCVRCNSTSNNAQVIEKAWRLLEGESNVNVNRIKAWLSNLQNGCAIEDGDGRRPTVFCLPDVLSSPLIGNHHHLHDVELLETHWLEIAKEYFRLDDNGWKTNSTPTGDWSVFYLYNQGQKVEENAEKCPVTMRLLLQLENFMEGCSFGNACFSVIGRNTKIAEHSGPCNVRTRCHLGIRAPVGYEMCIDGVVSTWKEGKCVLFDDSFLHSVFFNHCDGDKITLTSVGDRVVLMVDLWHYDLNASEKTIIQKLYS